HNSPFHSSIMLCKQFKETIPAPYRFRSLTKGGCKAVANRGRSTRASEIRRCLTNLAPLRVSSVSSRVRVVDIATRRRVFDTGSRNLRLNLPMKTLGKRGSYAGPSLAEDCGVMKATLQLNDPEQRLQRKRFTRDL